MSALTVVAQAELGTGGLPTWMLDNLVPLLLLLAVAVLLLWLGGGKGDNAGVMRRVGGVIIALGVIGLAVSGAGVELGTWIAGLFSGRCGGEAMLRIRTNDEVYCVDAVWLAADEAAARCAQAGRVTRTPSRPRTRRVQRGRSWARCP